MPLLPITADVRLAQLSPLKHLFLSSACTVIVLTRTKNLGQRNQVAAQLVIATGSPIVG